MEEPDYDVKKEIILSKLDACIAMLEEIREEYDIVGLIDINTVLKQIEKEVKEY